MAPRPWTVRNSLLLGLTLFAWGMNYLFVRIGLESATPIWLAALRAGSGFLALGVYLAVAAPRAPLSRKERGLAMLIGIPNTTLMLGLWFVAAQSVPPGEAAVLIYTFPVWVALLSIPVLRQRLSVLHWGSVALGLTGVVLVSEPWTGAGRPVPLLSLLELLGAAVSWAVATVVVQRQFRPEQMATVNGHQLVVGAAVLIGIALVVDPRRLPANAPSLWVSVAWMGVFGTAFAYAVWYDLLGKVPAATLSGYSFLVPLIALAASAAFLGERLDPIQALGVVLVLGSIYGISRAQARKVGIGPAGYVVPRPAR